MKITIKNIQIRRYYLNRNKYDLVRNLKIQNNLIFYFQIYFGAKEYDSLRICFHYLPLEIQLQCSLFY